MRFEQAERGLEAAAQLVITKNQQVLFIILGLAFGKAIECICMVLMQARIADKVKDCFSWGPGGISRAVASTHLSRLWEQKVSN